MTTNQEGNIALPLADPGIAGRSQTRSQVKASGLGEYRALSLAIALLVTLTVGAYGLYLFVKPVSQSARTTISDGDGAIASPASVGVVALGRLLPKDGPVEVGLPSGASDTRVQRVLVAVGDRVEAEQTIAVLDNARQLEIQKERAEAELGVQIATLAQVTAETRLSLAQAQAENAKAEAAMVLAEDELARAAKLLESGTGSKVRLEEARTKATQAEVELRRTTALIERFEAAGDEYQTDVLLANHNIELARAELAAAVANLSSSLVIAPRAGMILSVNLHTGERIADDGVIILGDVETMTAEIEVYQTDRKKVALGQTVTLTSPALEMPLMGKITTIGPMVARQSIISSDPAANADARVFRAIATLDETSSRLAENYTHLEVVARIAVDGQ